MPLGGRTALITGAGSGIGRALAIEAARRGLAVALVGRREAALRETRAQLAPGTECLILPGDVTLPAVRAALRDRLAAEWGLLHFLVNNAGIVAAGPLSETRDAELDRLMATNLVAPLALTRELLPLLRAAAPGRVVNLGSMLGDIAFPLFAAYSASKFGLRGLSSALRRELAGLGIGVTYVSPRTARTGATHAIARYVEPFRLPLDGAEVIARRTWAAAARGRNSAYPPGRERLFALVERLSPAIIDRAVRSLVESSGTGRMIEASVPPVPVAAADGPATGTHD
ncbi:Short-chain dehydrogenase [Tistlia consotensis]|uniref:Short-chain dehydrogenase n=1 Tax=Tistlia consotensis USBA 355 TaxID=560819 RepID=A0A1Y6CL92_9PROT|nr:SDR family oxidoreductase [Tistlia consotensis]SMF60161.1 Short-chain dehydrogenase [Tistlia consotensis USBA 355]SNR93751.1 Short-chain dehydrogenase [Tistlia consotensis]